MYTYSKNITTPASQRGMNLIELLIAMTIGVFLLLGLTVVFTNSSKTQRELEYTGQMVENGRYGIDLVYQDVRHAGSYGWLVSLPAVPTTAPDSCTTAQATLEDDAVPLPLFGYNTDATGSKAALGGHCGTLLSNANLADGSDVLVVRRANSNILGTAPVDGLPYIQSNVSNHAIQIGDPAATIPGETADNATVPSDLMKKDNATPGDIRAFETHIYFVAPCTQGSDTALMNGQTITGICQVGDDDVPALKRLVLTAQGGATVFNIEPLVEAVEYFQVEYGIDNSPTAADSTTGETGDSVVDVYRVLPNSNDEWSQVVSVRLYMLVRSLNDSKGYTDVKAYTLGSASPFNIAKADDAFKRHVFSAEASIANIAGRREIPGL